MSRRSKLTRGAHWQPPSGKKRPKEWHNGSRQDRIFLSVSQRLDAAYTQCCRCPDQAYRMVYEVGPLCECCFDGWWQEERVNNV